MADFINVVWEVEGWRMEVVVVVAGEVIFTVFKSADGVVVQRVV